MLSAIWPHVYSDKLSGILSDVHVGIFLFRLSSGRHIPACTCCMRTANMCVCVRQKDMNECKISKTELRRGTVARSSSADVALNARFAGVGHAETRGGKDEKRTEKEKGKRRKGKRRKREERREENRSTALGRDVGHLTTRTPPRTAEQRQRKGKKTKVGGKTRRELKHSTRSWATSPHAPLPGRRSSGKEKGKRRKTGERQAEKRVRQWWLKMQQPFFKDPAVVIENGLFQMLQRLRSNQDYQQWWLKMGCFKCFKDSVPIKTTNSGDWKWTASNASKTPFQSRRLSYQHAQASRMTFQKKLQWWLETCSFKHLKKLKPNQK